MNTDILFKPIQIGHVELKNRIEMSPMNMGYTGPEGYASEQSNAWVCFPGPEDALKALIRAAVALNKVFSPCLV
jgi:hypothetical protein